MNYIKKGSYSSFSLIVTWFSNHMYRKTKADETAPCPRITWFLLLRFPLTRILAYVCLSGGILHQLSH